MAAKLKAATVCSVLEPSPAAAAPVSKPSLENREVLLELEDWGALLEREDREDVSSSSLRFRVDGPFPDPSDTPVMRIFLLILRQLFKHLIFA